MMNKKETMKLANQVKRILESEERSYMTKEHKEEVYNNVMNETMSMMKRKPQMSAAQPVVIDRRSVDRAEFEYYYKKWYEETCVFSSLNSIFGNEYFQKIIKMGKRAVPFIYEKLKNRKIDFVAHAVPEIYQDQIVEDPKKFIGLEKFCELCIKKIEKEGDI